MSAPGRYIWGIHQGITHIYAHTKEKPDAGLAGGRFRSSGAARKSSYSYSLVSSG